MPQNFDIKALYQILIYLDSVGWNIGTITHKGENVFEIDVDNITFLAGEGFTGTWKILEGKVVCIDKNNFVMS